MPRHFKKAAGTSLDGRIIFEYKNIASLGADFEKQFRHIFLADALFMNTNRLMRNYGVNRSAIIGEILRVAPNFDNNQAYKSNPGGHHSDTMLKSFANVYGLTSADVEDLSTLVAACAAKPYLQEAATIGRSFLLTQI